MYFQKINEDDVVAATTFEATTQLELDVTLCVLCMLKRKLGDAADVKLMLLFIKTN